MQVSRAKPLTISIQHAYFDQALFFGVQTGVKLDAYRPAWRQGGRSTNVHAFPRPAQRASAPRVLRMPLPANDNLAPLP